MCFFILSDHVSGVWIVGFFSYIFSLSLALFHGGNVVMIFWKWKVKRYESSKYILIHQHHLHSATTLCLCVCIRKIYIAHQCQRTNIQTTNYLSNREDILQSVHEYTNNTPSPNIFQFTSNKRQVSRRHIIFGKYACK